MTKLPPQDHKEGTMYTEDEMRHVVSREVMKHRMEDFERGLTMLTNQVKDSNAKIQASLEALDHSLDKHYDHTDKCRNDIRDEIERDFVSKVEFATYMSKIQSVQWRTTGVIVGVIGTVGLLNKVGIL